MPPTPLFKKKPAGQNASSSLWAGYYLRLRNSTLMQNKRASLNIQQDKLQQQHSIWLLLVRVHFYSQYWLYLPFNALLIWTFLFSHIFPCWSSPLIVFSSGLSSDWIREIFCPCVADRHFTYSSWRLLEMKCLKKKLVAVNNGEWREISSVHTSFRPWKPCALQKKKKKRKATHSVQLHWIELKKKKKTLRAKRMKYERNAFSRLT